MRGGRFLEDCGFSEVNPDPFLPNDVIPWVLDGAHADAVWALSERLVGESFASPPAAGAPQAHSSGVKRRGGDGKRRVCRCSPGVL
ncbi:MAG: hypothetical protein ABI433_18700, partial [Burkholderiaceae bacterium]